MSKTDEGSNGAWVNMRRFAKELGPNDALFIFFAGHGFYDRVLDKGYWITTETREKVSGQPAVTFFGQGKRGEP